MADAPGVLAPKCLWLIEHQKPQKNIVAFYDVDQSPITYFSRTGARRYVENRRLDRWHEISRQAAKSPEEPVFAPLRLGVP
jgi:hypothetical protein